MRVVDLKDPATIAVEAAADWARGVPLAEFELEFQRRFVLCPERVGEPHKWASFKVDDSKPCEFCGRSGRQNFEEATRARGEMYTRVRAPESAHGRAKKS